MEITEESGCSDEVLPIPYVLPNVDAIANHSQCVKPHLASRGELQEQQQYRFLFAVSASTLQDTKLNLSLPSLPKFKRAGQWHVRMGGLCSLELSILLIKDLVIML